MSKSLTLYKLIILYMLQKVEFPLTNAQISDFILGREYTSYFFLQSALSELAETNLIHVETTSNTSYYTLTRSGEQTLGYFKNRIPDSYCDEINQYIDENQLRLRDEVCVVADYFKNTAGEYSVRCRVKEKYTDLIELTISVPDETQAKSVCLKWNQKCQSLYAHIMKELL